MDAEAPRTVVRRRDHAAAARVAADDERLRAELGILELLDGGVERVEVEVRDDHHSRLVQASGSLDRLRAWPSSRRRSSAAPTSSRAATTEWPRSLWSCGRAPPREPAAGAPRPSHATGRRATP